MPVVSICYYGYMHEFQNCNFHKYDCMYINAFATEITVTISRKELNAIWKNKFPDTSWEEITPDLLT